jgi:membrane-bound metal-dependent hydrolase YbcI (DUF457 family)
MAIGGIFMLGSVLQGYLAPDCLQLTGLIGFCVLGSLFPDIDTDSKGQNLFYGILITVDGILIYQQQYIAAAWLGLIAMLPALGHHRGWTHTWWAMFLVPLPIVIIPYLLFHDDYARTSFNFYIAFTLGYFSHLLLDRKFT